MVKTAVGSESLVSINGRFDSVLYENLRVVPSGIVIRALLPWMMHYHFLLFS